MTYLSGLPTDASHKLTRMSEANHRRKEELRGMALLGKLRRAEAAMMALEEIGEEDGKEGGEEGEREDEEGEEEEAEQVKALL